VRGFCEARAQERNCVLTGRTALVWLLAAACSRSGDPPPGSRAQLSPDGARAYQTACASCHARPGTGAPLTGDDAAWAERRAQGAEVLLAHTVNGYRGMPPLGTCGLCSEAELRTLVAYVAGLPP
jgi:cytochrome c5